MVLAIGIVVDDAIVVVENTERLMEEEGLGPREAAHRTMDEVSGALIAIALVLIGVFLPTSFIPGISGQFYQQFAITIMTATAISAFVSLTLSPSIAALILRPKTMAEPSPGWRGSWGRFTAGFNRRLNRLGDRYGRYTARSLRVLGIVGIAYASPTIGLAGWRFSATPTGFIPAQDQGYLIGVVQLPPGASVQRTTAVLEAAQAIALRNPATEATVACRLRWGDFHQRTQCRAMFVAPKPRSERGHADEVANELRGALAEITAGNLLVSRPAAGRGIGTGARLQDDDRGSLGVRLCGARAGRVRHDDAREPTEGLASVFTLFNTRAAPYADIDRERAERSASPVENVFATLGTYLGSAYINDFTPRPDAFRGDRERTRLS